MTRTSQCWRCLLADKVTIALSGPNGEIPPRLRPLAEAITSMPRPNSGYAWMRTNPRVVAMLRSLANGEIALDHAALDSLPASRTTEYIRELLISTGTLPARDRHLATFQRWFVTKRDSIASAECRAVVERFVRWDVERKLRQKAMHGQVSVGVFLAAKQTVTVTIQFLNWLDSRGCALQECSQHDIDTWFATGTATRWRSTRFIYWARKQRIISDITIPARSVRSSPAISDDERIALLRQLLVNDDLIMAHRLIGAFVLLFGQPLSRIVALTRDAIDTSEPIPKTRIAEDWHSLPEPLSTMLCAYLDQRWNANTAANADTKWLFPGTMPRQNMHIMSAAKALRNVGLPALAARNGTWLQLVREAPPLVLAKTLGIDPQTAMRHANRAGTNYLAYSALREQDAAIQLGNSSLSNS